MNYLKDEEIFNKIVFIAGFIACWRFNQFKENPLSAICCCILLGLCYTWLGTTVWSWSPEFFRPMITTLIIVFIFYQVFLKLCKKESTKPFLSIKMGGSDKKVYKYKKDEEENSKI